MGGGLRTYTAAGVDVVEGYGEGERCRGGRGQILLPLAEPDSQRAVRFGGADQQLT